jgi:type IV pilus assembly protein PilW
VVEGIVALKAQYGFASGAFNPATGLQVSQWSNTMVNADGDPATGSAGDYQQVAAIRVAVVARSKVPEKPSATNGQCSASTAKPVVFATASPANVTAVPVTVEVAQPGDSVSWKCYRYRVFETIIPIRNAGWRPTWES